MAYSNIFKFPPVQTVLDMSPSEGEKLDLLFGNGFYGRLKNSYNMYGIDEARRNYDMQVGNLKRTLERAIDEKVFGRMTSGADVTDVNSGILGSANQAIQYYTNAWNQLPDTFKNEQPQTIQQMLGGEMKDPGSDMVVKVGGEIVKESTFGKTPKITEPMVGMQSSGGQIEFVPQSQVEQKKTEGWGVINGTSPQLEAMKAEAEAKMGGSEAPAVIPPTNNQGQPIKIGPTLFNQLVSKGLTENDIERRGNDIYIKPTSGFYSQAGGVAPTDATPRSAGATGTAGGTSTGTSGGGTTGSFVDTVDTTGWPDYMVQTLKAYEEYVQKIIDQGKVINPNITIDQAKIDQFKAQAKAEMEPYYGQIFRQTEADLAKAINDMKKSYDESIRDIGLKYGQSLESTQESFARRGLEFSSERDKAEKLLADETSRNIESATDSAKNQAYTIGSTAERFLGTGNVPAGTDYNVASGFSPIQKQAGVYGLSGATGSRDLFSPLGNITGSNERQQIYDTSTRENELINNERGLRSINYL